MKIYVYYKEKGREMIYTYFSNIEIAQRAATILGGYIK